MPPLVAIIVRSKNEMPHVRAALDMLKRQTFTDFELFAIDSGFTDGSLDLLREYCDADHLIEIPPEDYEPGKVLNDAIAYYPNYVSTYITQGELLAKHDEIGAAIDFADSIGLKTGLCYDTCHGFAAGLSGGTIYAGRDIHSDYRPL